MATCYRHPNRETGVSCSNCGRPICPDCMTSTSVGMRCPECARQKTRVVRRGYAPSEPIATYTLIGVNVLAWVGTLATGASFTANTLGGPNSVFGKCALNGPLVADGDFWRIVTSGFMHYGIFHLAINMYALYIVGQLLEPAIGQLRFVLVYFVALLGGSFGALLVTPNGLTAGASGAVFGVMAATVLVARRRGVDPIANQIGFWLVLNIAFTFTWSQISIGGHIGGLVSGAVVAWILTEGPSQLRLPRWAPTLIAGLLGVAAFVGSLAIA